MRGEHLELHWVDGDAHEDHHAELDDVGVDEGEEGCRTEGHHILDRLEATLEWEGNHLLCESFEQPYLHVHPHHLEEEHETDWRDRKDGREGELKR